MDVFVPWGREGSESSARGRKGRKEHSRSSGYEEQEKKRVHPRFPGQRGRKADVSERAASW